MKPLVAIVGRPNVGKSTLFNRIAGKPIALVEDRPGVTRDRIFADSEHDGKAFLLADTGGFVASENDPLLKQVRAQAKLAIEESDAVLLVMDGRAGLTAADEELAAVLRRSQKPVFLAVNKVDLPSKADTLLAEFHALGFENVFAISAEHSLGIRQLLDAVIEAIPAVPPPAEGEEAAEGDPNHVRLAIIGRPNVGKSTLVNALLGEERMVASDLPGTTRDAVDTELKVGDRTFVLTDTAGIRRRGSVHERLEKVSVLGALRALGRSDLAVLVLDATEPGVDQDARLASLVEERGRGLILVVNKWDLAKKAGKIEEEYRAFLKDRLKFMAYAPIVFVSALEGMRVEKILEVAGQLADQFHFRATTPRMNKLLEQIVDSHPAPIAKGRPLRLYFIRQVRTSPPTFAVICNRPTYVPDSYRRYLVNQLRDAFGLRVPIHLVLKDRPGEAKRQARKKPK